MLAPSSQPLRTGGIVSRTVDRIAALGGVLYIVFAVIGFAIASSFLGDFEAAPATLVAHLESHRPSPLFWFGVGLESLGLLLFVLFGVYLAAVIARESRPAWLAYAAGGLAVLAVTAKVASIALALEAYLHPARLGAQVVAGLMGANDVASGVTQAADGVFMLLAGCAMLTAQRVPRWLAWGGLAAGLATIVAGAGVDAAQGVGLLWFAAIGWWLLRRREPAPAVATRSAYATA
jgi:hypothetical protein